MTIVTKTGDDGTTGLYGAPRVSKASARIAAYGDVDEVNAALGLLRTEHGLPADLEEQAGRIQQLLIRAGADLATPLESEAKPPRMEDRHVAEIEEWITAHERTLAPLRNFILPGGTRIAALLHHVRTVCRRAERSVVALAEQEAVTPALRKYVNRLSDWAFVAARAANAREGTEDVPVHYDA